MKRIIYFLIFAVAIAAAGCTNRSTNEPANTTKSAEAIKGHTYRASDGTNYISFYFASNFTCSMTSSINGEYTSNSHMTYAIDGTNVDVFTDNSSFWQEAYRVTLLYHMVYYPDDDTIVFEGSVFTRNN